LTLFIRFEFGAGYCTTTLAAPDKRIIANRALPVVNGGFIEAAINGDSSYFVDTS
jgi:hypothetical protein